MPFKKYSVPDFSVNFDLAIAFEPLNFFQFRFQSDLKDLKMKKKIKLKSQSERRLRLGLGRLRLGGGGLK